MHWASLNNYKLADDRLYGIYQFWQKVTENFTMKRDISIPPQDDEWCSSGHYFVHSCLNALSWRQERPHSIQPTFFSIIIIFSNCSRLSKYSFNRTISDPFTRCHTDSLVTFPFHPFALLTFRCSIGFFTVNTLPKSFGLPQDITARNMKNINKT